MSSPYFKVEPCECEKDEDRGSPSLDVPVPPPRCEDEVEASDAADAAEGAPDEWNEIPETPAPRRRSVDNAAAAGPPCGGGRGW